VARLSRNHYASNLLAHHQLHGFASRFSHFPSKTQMAPKVCVMQFHFTTFLHQILFSFFFFIFYNSRSHAPAIWNVSSGLRAPMSGVHLSSFPLPFEGPRARWIQMQIQMQTQNADNDRGHQLERARLVFPQHGFRC